jgi:hypothetical protein
MYRTALSTLSAISDLPTVGRVEPRLRDPLSLVNETARPCCYLDVHN